MRFDWVEVTEREIVYVFWDMSRSDVSHIRPPTDNSVITPLRNEEHLVHACEHRLCPVSCQLCKRLCSGDHLHGLVPDQSHLCGCVCDSHLRDVINFSVLDKNTLVVLCVLPRAYVK
jgi:hypothetical protein